MKSLAKKIAQYYLWLLAKLTLWHYKPAIIAVTGSTGRQTVKEEILKVLSDKFNIRMSPKNYNAEIGVPMSILGLIGTITSSSKLNWLKLLLLTAPKIVFRAKNFSEKLILELAIDRPRDMDYLTTLIKPEIVIITNITSEYEDNFGGLDKIAQEYAKLIKTVSPQGLVILNYDDLRLRGLINLHPQTVTYGLTQEAKIHPENIEQTSTGQQFNFKNNEGKYINYQLNKFGVHHLYAVLIAQVVKNYYQDRGV